MESLISPEGHYEESSPGRPYMANPEGVKNVPLSTILPVSSDDMHTETLPSRCCGSFPVLQTAIGRDPGQTWPLGGISTRSSTLRLCHTLAATGCRTSHVHARWSHVRHTLQIPRTCCGEKPWESWIGQAEVLIWMWSILVVLHQTIIKQYQHYRP